MKRISRKELDDIADSIGLRVHKECGGYRIVKDGRDIFPSDGICPVTTKRECLAFLKGCVFVCRPGRIK